MRQTMVFFLMFMFIGCNEAEEKKQEEIKIEEKEKDAVTSTQKVEKKDILQQLGFEVNGEKITIDMNQTTNFIKQFEIEMHGKADEIERKIENADLNFSRDFGVEIDDTHVAIDLNKTRDMLQQINILMKDILLDVNHTIH